MKLTQVLTLLFGITLGFAICWGWLSQNWFGDQPRFALAVTGVAFEGDTDKPLWELNRLAPTRLALECEADEFSVQPMTSNQEIMTIALNSVNSDVVDCILEDSGWGHEQSVRLGLKKIENGQ